MYCNYGTHFPLKFDVFSARILCLENFAAELIWSLENTIVYFIPKVEGENKVILPETQLSASCIFVKIMYGLPEGFSMCILNRLGSFQEKKIKGFVGIRMHWTHGGNLLETEKCIHFAQEYRFILKHQICLWTNNHRDKMDAFINMSSAPVVTSDLKSCYVTLHNACCNTCGVQELQ